MAGRYRVDEVIARGGAAGAADVYRAHDETLHRAVAVTWFRDGAVDPADRRHEFARRAGVRHRHLVQVLDAGDHAGRPFVVFEVGRRTLSERLAAGPLRPYVAARLGRDIAGALARLHQAGLVHRDVKPVNVLFARDGRALLADFGVAAPVDDRGAGAPGDIRALGLLLLEAVTGRAPFDGSPNDPVNDGVDPAPPFPPTLPAGWRQILRAMTDPDPTRRPTAPEAATALAAIEPETPSPRPVSAPERRAPAWVTDALLPAAAVVAVVVLGVAVLPQERGATEPPAADAAAVDTTVATSQIAASAPATTVTTAPQAPDAHAEPASNDRPADSPRGDCARLEQDEEDAGNQEKGRDEGHRDDKGPGARDKDSDESEGEGEASTIQQDGQRADC